MWKGLTRRGLIASLIIGLLGAAFWAHFYTVLSFINSLLQFEVPLNMIQYGFDFLRIPTYANYSIPLFYPGIIIGFLSCFFMSVIYLKGMKEMSGEDVCLVGCRISSFAFSLSLVCTGLVLLVSTLISPVIRQHNMIYTILDYIGEILFGLYSIFVAFWGGLLLGGIIGLILYLVFGIWVLKLVTKPPELASQLN